MASNGSSERIRVAVRMRKLLRREQGANIYWKTHETPNPKNNEIWSVEGNKKFVFDRVFSAADDNEVVYDDIGRETIESAMQGVHSTIFAYGQTGSGKTHTMLGAPNDQGLIRSAINHMFSIIEASTKKQFLLRVSYLEIYNENVTDLLVGPDERKKSLAVMDDSQGHVYVDGLSECTILSPDEIFELMSFGERNRHFGATNMNERSSRSHTIFRIIIESSGSEGEEIGQVINVSHLNLVDLAGSERASQTGAVGDRLREGININKSLMVLGQVISKLSDGQDDHIPFRDSKLTRILKNSLGGNARTTIISTVTPTEQVQTRSTLEFASRAKTITQHASVNEVLDDVAMMKRMQKQIELLESELAKIRGTQDQLTAEKIFTAQLEEREAVIRDLREQVIHLNPVTSLIQPILIAPNGNGQRKMPNDRRKTWCAPRKSTRVSFGGALGLQQFKMSLLNEDHNRTDKNDIKEEEEEENTLDSMVMSNLKAACADSSLLSPCLESNKNNLDDFIDFSTEKPKMSFVTRRSRKRTVQFALAPPSPISFIHVESANSDEGADEDEIAELNACDNFPVWEASKTKRRVRHTNSMPNLNESMTGTPKVVLRQRLSMKEDTIRKLSQDFEELQEFTRLESEIQVDQKKEEMMEYITKKDQEINRLNCELRLLTKEIDVLKSDAFKSGDKQKQVFQELEFFRKEVDNLWEEKAKLETKCLKADDNLSGAMEETAKIREALLKLSSELSTKDEECQKLKDDLKNVSAQLQENSFRTGNKSSSATGNASADSEQLQKILYQQELLESRSKELQQKTVELLELKKKFDDVSLKLQSTDNRENIDNFEIGVDSNQNFQDLKTKLLELEAQRQGDVDQIKVLIKDLDEKSAQLVQLKDNFDGELAKHAEESALMKSKLAESEEKVSTVESLNKHLNDKAEELIEKSEGDRDDLLSIIENLETKVLESEVQHEKNLKLISTLSTDLEAKTHELSSLEAKFSSVSAQNLDMKNKLATLAIRMEDKGIVEPAAVECKCEMLTAELESLRLQYTLDSSQLEDVKHKLSQAEHDLKVEKGVVIKLEKKLSESQNEILSKQAAMEKLHCADKLKEEVQNRMLQQEEKIVELEIKIEEDALLIKSQSDELVAKDDLCKQLEEKLSQNTSHNDLDSLSQKVSELESKLVQEKQVIINQKDVIAKLVAERDNLKVQIADKCVIIESLSHKVSELETKQEQEMLVISQQKKEIVENNVECDNLKVQIAEKRVIIESLSHKVSEMEQEMQVSSQLKDDIAKYFAECDNLKHRVTEKCNIIENLSVKLSVLETKQQQGLQVIAQPKEDMVSCIDECDNLKLKVTEKCDIIASLEKQLENVICQLQNSTDSLTMLGDVKIQKDECIQEIQSLNRQLSAGQRHHQELLERNTELEQAQTQLSQQIKEQAQRIQDLEKVETVFEETRTQLAENEEKLSTIVNRMSKQTEELRQLRQDKNDSIELRSQYESLKQDNVVLSAKKSDLESTLFSLELKFSSLLSEKENVMKKMELSESKLADVESQKLELETRLQDLEQQLLTKQSDKSTSEKFQKMIEDKNSELATLRTQFSHLDSEKNREIALLRCQISKISDERNAEIASLQGQLNLAEENKMCEVKLLQLQLNCAEKEKLSQMNNILYELNRIFMGDENDSMCDDVCEDLTLIYTKLERLLDRKNHLQVKLGQADARLADAQAQSSKFKEEASKLLSKYEAKEVECQNLIHSFKAATSQLKTLQKQNLSVKLAEAEQRSEAVSAQYEADIASKCGIISGLRSEIECLSVQLKNALKELPLMEAKIKEDAIVHADKIKELEQEIETLHALKTRSEHLTAEREESQTILNSLELDLSKHKAQLDVLRSENANLSKKLVESESLYKLTCSELEENRMAMADMTKKEATSAELIQKLNSEQGSTVNYMSKQVEELISLRSQNAALKQDLDQLANQTRENQLILSEKDQVVKSLEAKLSELEKEKVIWQKKHRDATAQLANMEKELNNSELKSQELEKKLALTKPSPATAPVVDNDIVAQIRTLRRELAEKKLENMTLNVKLTRIEDDWEDKQKRLVVELNSERGLCRKLKDDLRRLQQQPKVENVTFTGPSETAETKTGDDRKPLHGLDRNGGKAAVKFDYKKYENAFWASGGSGTVKEIAFDLMKSELEKLERKCYKYEKDLKLSQDDANQVHRSASEWKSRFMKLKIHTEKCESCKPFTAAIIAQILQQHQQQQLQQQQLQQQQLQQQQK